MTLLPLPCAVELDNLQQLESATCKSVERGHRPALVAGKSHYYDCDCSNNDSDESLTA